VRQGDHFDMKEPYWKVKSLREMTREEWESLCDGCGICCLEKVIDEETDDVRLTTIACEFLEIETCRCSIYGLRTVANPTCIQLTPKNIQQLGWLPRTCAYRSVAEGRGLPSWHPLVSGDPEAVHKAGISVRNKVISGLHVRPEDLERFF
jgi:uncharacterized cysteine cluster protein YcgN (CxxCxxCC family)